MYCKKQSLDLAIEGNVGLRLRRKDCIRLVPKTIAGTDILGTDIFGSSGTVCLQDLLPGAAPDVSVAGAVPLLQTNWKLRLDWNILLHGAE